MILLLDNYDSFTYNLYQFIAGVESEISGIQKDQIDSKVKVVRNDQITPEKILELAPEALVISPGPGKPSDAGICIEAIQKLKGKIPMLGVCLGHQAMAEAFGATVSHAGQLMHGKTSKLKDVKTECPVPESDISNPGGKISFACSKGRDTSGRTDCDSAKRGQRDHGDGTQRISNLWVTVSSGIRDDTAGTSDDRELY